MDDPALSGAKLGVTNCRTELRLTGGNLVPDRTTKFFTNAVNVAPFRINHRTMRLAAGFGLSGSQFFDCDHTGITIGTARNTHSEILLDIAGIRNP